MMHLWYLLMLMADGTRSRFCGFGVSDTLVLDLECFSLRLTFHSPPHQPLHLEPQLEHDPSSPVHLCDLRDQCSARHTAENDQMPNG